MLVYDGLWHPIEVDISDHPELPLIVIVAFHVSLIRQHCDALFSFAPRYFGTFYLLLPLCKTRGSLFTPMY